MDLETLYNIIENIRKYKPLVHNITNYVTAKDCANILLALGARPVMADSSFDVSDIQKRADSLNINLGTMDFNKEAAILLAGKVAKKNKHHIVLDPVGIGASQRRFDLCKQIIEHIKPSVIKGNLSEILKLYDEAKEISGVDLSDEDRENKSLREIENICKSLAKKYKCVVIITGEIDFISDGNKVGKVFNGSYMMENITGTGCQLSALLGGFISCENDIFTSCLAGLILMGISGEIAFENLRKYQGSGNYGNNLIDAIYNIDKNEFLKRGKYEII